MGFGFSLGLGQLGGKVDKLEGQVDESFKELKDALKGPLQQEMWMKKGEERERNNSNKRCASCVFCPAIGVGILEVRTLKRVAQGSVRASVCCLYPHVSSCSLCLPLAHGVLALCH